MPEPEYDIAFSGDGESAIYVLSRMSGEGNDRKAIAGDFLLTKTEIERNHKIINAGDTHNCELWRLCFEW